MKVNAGVGRGKRTLMKQDEARWFGKGSKDAFYECRLKNHANAAVLASLEFVCFRPYGIEVTLSLRLPVYQKTTDKTKQCKWSAQGGVV